MLYQAIFTVSKKSIYINTTSVSTAHAMAARHRENDEKVKVYPLLIDENGLRCEGLDEGSRIVVRRTTANAVRREGSNFQWMLYREARLAAIDDPDVKDLISVSRLALLESALDGRSICDCYAFAYREVNRYLRSISGINLSVTARRTVYLEDVEGDIIAVNNEIARILREDEKYTPNATDFVDEVERREKIAAVKAITAHLTPIQVSICGFLAKGLTLRAIAAELGCTAPTIQVHINKIRKVGLKLYPDRLPFC